MTRNANMTRRDLLRIATTLTAGSFMTRYAALAEPYRSKAKITRIQAMQMKVTTATDTLIKIDTDAGLTGYGESGASGPMARARIETMKDLLIGKDPLSIEQHFFNMTTLMHGYVAHIPTVSGIDMALWDLAGKITGLPVCVLLGGPFRESIRMYSHGERLGLNMLDKGSCREWAAKVKEKPEGFDAYKNSINDVLGVPLGRYTVSLDREQLHNIAVAYGNCREAVGDSLDIAVHCHNEFDTPSACAIAKAVEPMNPMFIEDGLNPPYSEAWLAFKRSTRVPLLTGEKLEMTRQFKPFLDNQAVDIIHPDLCFTGGITGARKIADYALLTRNPVALHNVGTLVLTHACAHFGASIHNFFRSESALGWPGRQVEAMAATNPPVVRKGYLKVPMEPGLGVDLNLDFLKKNVVEGEPYWE